MQKNIISNYRPISLLPLCGKMLERIIYDSLYPHFFGNNLITDKQSGYRRNDSTIKQLLSITHAIYKAFDNNQEIRAVFLDISRAFDRVWHEGIIFKLKQLGVEGDALNIIKSFLADRKQRVVLDGQVSNWVPIEAGVPQGSILGPLLFLVYINDLVEVVESDIDIFADDTFIFRILDPDSTQILTDDLRRITEWAYQWKMVFNPDMTKQAIEIIFSRKYNKSNPPPLTFNSIPVKRDIETKHLGMVLDSKLTFHSHLAGTNGKLSKARQGLGLMRQLKKWVSPSVLETIYKLYDRPHLDYGDIIYHYADLNKQTVVDFETSSDLMKKVETIQYDAARIITGAWRGSSREKLYNDLGWESLNDRRIMRKLCLLHETYYSNFPRYLDNIINEVRPRRPRIAENQTILNNIPHRTDYFQRTFFPSTIKDWNRSELDNIRNIESKVTFKAKLLCKIRPKKKPHYGLTDHNRVRHITMLRMDLSPLHAHKAKYKFPGATAECVVCDVPEDTNHFLLTCRSYWLSRATMLQKVTEIIGIDISTLPKKTRTSILLYGRGDLSDEANSKIMKIVTDFTIKTKRFDTT